MGRVRKPPEPSKEEILDAIRKIEDDLGNLIERFSGGTLDDRAAVYGMREIRLRLKRLNDVPEPPPPALDSSAAK